MHIYTHTYMLHVCIRIHPVQRDLTSFDAKSTSAHVGVLCCVGVLVYVCRCVVFVCLCCVCVCGWAFVSVHDGVPSCID